MTTALSIGYRVWFDNCGLEPHWAAEIVGDENDYRPWTEEDSRELEDWQQFVDLNTTDGI